MNTLPNDKIQAELWIENLKNKVEVEKKKVEIRGWIEPLRMLIQSGKDELASRGFPDTQGGGNLDVAQQVLTKIEEVNNR